MAQKSSKNLSTLSKHMSNDTKLQVNTNTVTNKLIIINTLQHIYVKYIVIYLFFS